MDVDDLSEIISFNLSLLNDDSEPYIAPNKLPSVIKEAVKEVITTSSPFGASSEATEVYSLDGSERLTFTRSKNWTSINPGSSRNHLIEINLDAIGIGEEFDWMWNYDKCLALDAKMTLLFTANTRSIHLINEKSVLVFDADEHLKSLFTYIN